MDYLITSLMHFGKNYKGVFLSRRYMSSVDCVMANDKKVVVIIFSYLMIYINKEYKLKYVNYKRNLRLIF